MVNEIEILDTTLRDGSYAIDFQFTADDTAVIASALESAGIRLIEVAHGLGLGAMRAGHEGQASSDEAYLRAAAAVLRTAAFGAFFIPGIGAEDDLRLAADCGMGFVRVGTNITEIAASQPFVAIAKKLGLTVWCNLMKSYAVAPEQFGVCARQAEDAGADVVCLVDSAGCMFPEDIRAYVEAARAACGLRIGFHGHDNLSLAMANAIAAHEAGVDYVDASLQGMGRSEGNTVTEALVAILQKRGLVPDMDVNGLLDISEAYVRPMLRRRGLSGLGVTFGRAKFHSSFLGRVLTAAARTGVDPRDLILRLGERDTINAPTELVEGLAEELAREGPRPSLRISLGEASASSEETFEGLVRARVRELREKARKFAMTSVLNVVVTPFETTSVSPSVETGFGCAFSNIMLAEPEWLESVLRWAEGVVDYVLIDPGDRPIPEGTLKKTAPLAYCDNEMWMRAAARHLALLLGGSLRGKRILVRGVPRLTARLLALLAEAGAEASAPAGFERVAEAASFIGFAIGIADPEEVLPEMDAVACVSPRNPILGPDWVRLMRPGALLYDGGIGSLTPEAVMAAEERGIQVVRVDMRSTLAATALELINLRGIVFGRMGRETWGGVPVVAGGLIGRAGDIVVDSVKDPARVIGVADGKGGIVRPSNDDPSIQTVRRVIAEKRLQASQQVLREES
ncbi:MAG TPA: hypothetical protein PLO62_05730 [Candidatus Hydrogenedentes bacterium]|nr:hypothetical protein [Candidatus Hydrogenedentota bacterium]HOS02674.1 hypothetical protein [Candidatus Hydrogenedentota bacterium]